MGSFNLTDELIAGLWIGVSGSIVASVIFTFILFTIRPRIRICSKIGKIKRAEEEKDESGKMILVEREVFLFKIINRSWFFKIYDLNVKLSVYKNEDTLNGTNQKISDKGVKLKTNGTWILNRFNVRHLFQERRNIDRLNTRTDYAATFGSFDNLSEILGDNKKILFQVYAKHSLSGFSRVIQKEYKHVNHIEDGKFKSGNSFKLYIEKKK